jgi:hypothetical protein
MTPDYIRRSLDTYPIEFLDMQKNYRVLDGEDMLAQLEIKREHLRLQCERELKGAALHLRTGYIQSGGSKRALHRLLVLSLRRLVPVCKALLILGDRTVPGSKADILSAVEERFNIGDMVLTEIYQLAAQKPKRSYEQIFDAYTKVVDNLIETVDTMEIEGS